MSSTAPPNARATSTAGALSQWASYYYSAFFNSGLPLIGWIKPHWWPSEMPSQRGKVVFITGGNSGTGYETARAYYARGARVIIGCRSEERAQAAIEEIKHGATRDVYGAVSYETPGPGQVGSVEYIHLDLSDLDNVEACARALGGMERLDVLYANAGIMATEPGQVTKQGYPLQFGTNVLGHQRLISLLLPLLGRSSTRASPARVVVLTSNGHGFAPVRGIDYASLEPTSLASRELGKWAAYGQSKFGDILLAKYVHNNYGPGSGSPASKKGTQGDGDQGGRGGGEILAFAVHPGSVATNLANHLDEMASARKYTSLTPWWQVPPATGALNQLWAGEMPTTQARALSGSYIAPFQVAVMPRPDALDPEAAETLWEWCEARGRKGM